MIYQTDPLTLVSALGALEVQIATRLLHEPLPVTQTHLCNVLHKTDKTVAIALYNLDIYQICTRSPEGWRITSDGAFRLFGIKPLPRALQAPLEPEVPVDKPVDTCPVDAFPQEKGRKISDSSLSSSTSSSSYLTSLKLEKNLLLELPELEPEPEVEPEPEPESEPELEPKPKSPEKYRECYKTALAAGIWEPKAKELARMPHVTPELIEYHVGKVLSEKKAIPLAIFRIERNWEIRNPPDQKPPDWQDGQRYVTGEYADFINH